MKHSSGFTLVEVMGVIILIAAISLLAFPPILEHVRKSQNEISKATLNLIYSGTDLYVDSEKLRYLKYNGNTYCIPLRSIVEKGFLNDPIQDAATKENMDLDRNVVKAVYQNKEFRYSLMSASSCVEKQSLATFSDKMSQSDEVMNNDPGGNLRYVGKNPNNYVRFNNELWRVIGLFNGQVKIIREDVYHDIIAWNTTNQNNWAIATLQNTFNTIYLNGMDNTSKSLIDHTHVWQLGGIHSDDMSNFTRINLYNSERSTTVNSGNSTVWTGAIGLMYPSDYGYATSSTNSVCNTTTMFDWNNATAETECGGKNWLYDDSRVQWTITSASDNASIAFIVDSDGTVFGGYSVTNTYSARPVLYLKSNVGIIDGIGSSDDPFILDFIS